ncbi:enoyl-CoA hydratase-related protein [Oceanimonas doudoroffii]|uniref:2,3-dehydroadipyl-CoA hydratase n=1 Tax=Oceanimonas doudoroffii TaxID=84158 RepID=A0A233RHU5_9GAMM|nr:enoyl-CoA hydratase-related protein [Oceanimonas doudoroffii]OXY82969.1 2,3-dehydroadipyl-CoA hydratase [Oceanimonas doudoroffii]
MSVADIRFGEIEEGVLTLTLNRPERRNALRNQTLRELGDALAAAATTDAVRAVVIQGNERCFAAGADLEEMRHHDAVSLQQDERPALWKRIDDFNKPLIAAVNGYALGAGLELVLHCDLVVAGEGTLLGLPEIKLGIMPGAGGTQRLSRQVGQQTAMQMVLTGEPISAERAHALGLVGQICVPALTAEYARRLARQVAAQAPLAVQAAKGAIKACQETSLSQGLRQERQAFVWLAGTEDRNEGINAFLEKRAPNYRGK